MKEIKNNALWVFCETNNKCLLPVALQLIGKARELADTKGAVLYGVVIGEIEENEVASLYRSGADEVINLRGKALMEKLEGPYADSLIELATKYNPDILLIGATPFGRAFAPRVAAALETGLTADCTVLEIDSESGLLLQTRPAFGGNMMATIQTASCRPQMATVRPGIFAMPVESEKEDVTPIVVDYTGAESLVKLLKESAREKTEDISESKIIVAAGRGIGQKKNMKLVAELAEKLGGSVGVTRPLVDMGFAQHSCQIGQTGCSVAPDLLVCCGISGAVQHIAGIGGAKTVVAINTDPKAPIFSVADYKIVGDCVEILPKLIEALSK